MGRVANAGAGRVCTIWLLIAASIAWAGVFVGARVSPSDFVDLQIEAARLMRDCTAAIAAQRVGLGIPIDSDLDPNRTGLIGYEFTEITTSMGLLEAKRTSTNPAFAALMVRYFHAIGLQPGDVVAVGASGSFPALILATLSAARVMDLKPVIVYSVGASSFGANIPGFTFIEMLRCCRANALLAYDIDAVSLGGDADAGLGAGFGDSVALMMRIAEGAGVPIIREERIGDSIQRRLDIFDEVAGRAGRPVGCFVNVGGNSANYGNTMASLDFPNGLVNRPPVMATHPERGLIFEYAARGVPVINLLDVRGLAVKNGLPVDPVPMPGIGEGNVYKVQRSARWASAVFVFGAIAAAGVGIRRHVKKR